MATIGLRNLYRAPITIDEQGVEGYGTPVRMAKAIGAEMSVEVAEAILYADDGADEIAKEFISGELTLNVNDLMPVDLAAILGQTQDDDGVVYAGEMDDPPYMAMGFCAKKANGTYKYLWLFKVKFAIPSESYNTKGNSIEFTTPEITGQFIKRSDGNWKAEHVGAPLKIGNDFEHAACLEAKMLDKENPRSSAAALAEIQLEGRQFKTAICVTTLYSYIEKGVFLTLTNADLPEKPKKKRKYRKVKELKRPPRGESIENRPADAEGRDVFGYWEMDTIYSGKKTSKRALLVLNERKSRKEIIEPMPDRTAESTIKALDRIERRYGALFREIFKGITVDNGSEFADVERLERSAIRKGKRTKFYDCHPYSSFERGSNENQNKRIRRRHPKGTNFGKVSTAAIKQTETWINNYPRKILGWKTWEMVFRECLAML